VVAVLGGVNQQKLVICLLFTLDWRRVQMRFRGAAVEAVRAMTWWKV
jgi:hypothetical protein